MKTLLAVVLGVSAFATSVGAASLTLYDSRAAFDVAAPGTTLETFEGFTSDVSFVGSPLDVGGFTVTYSGTVSGSFNIIDVPPAALSLNAPNATTFLHGGVLDGETIVLTFDSAINAFGADFSALNDGTRRSKFLIAGQEILLPVAAGTVGIFFGVVSDTAFTTVTLQGFEASEGFGMDNVAYGNSVTPVPVPAALPLLASAIAAVAGLGAVRRRG